MAIHYLSVAVSLELPLAPLGEVLCAWSWTAWTDQALVELWLGTPTRWYAWKASLYPELLPVRYLAWNVASLSYLDFPEDSDSVARLPSSWASRFCGQRKSLDGTCLIVTQKSRS